jgi:membrane associated rhomboid family serine protease
MIPLTDMSRRPSRFPVATASIIALNGFGFIVELAAGDQFVIAWSAVPADISAGHHLITLVTAMFMHASWSHIIGNMVFLWAFGPTIEDAMGPGRYTSFYLTGGIVAMLTQIAADPASMIPSLGASGAIAAVMGAFLVTYPRDRIKVLYVLGWFVSVGFVPAIVLIGVWFLVQLVSFGSVVEPDTGGVAYLAHVGGMIFGAVAARWFKDPGRLSDRRGPEWP